MPFGMLEHNWEYQDQISNFKAKSTRPFIAFNPGVNLSQLSAKLNQSAQRQQPIKTVHEPIGTEKSMVKAPSISSPMTSVSSGYHKYYSGEDQIACHPHNRHCFTIKSAEMRSFYANRPNIYFAAAGSTYLEKADRDGYLEYLTQNTVFFLW